MKKTNLPSLRAQNELKKLGNDISIARKKRKITQQRLADGAGVNVSTIRRLEAGDHGISLGVLAMALIVLGENARLGNMLDMAKDDIGLMLDNQKLPKRVRGPRKPKDLKTQPAPAVRKDDEPGEAF